jgi:hypothetical protein
MTRGGWGGGGVKTTENKIHWPRWEEGYFDSEIENMQHQTYNVKIIIIKCCGEISSSTMKPTFCQYLG